MEEIIWNELKERVRKFNEDYLEKVCKKMEHDSNG